VEAGIHAAQEAPGSEAADCRGEEDVSIMPGTLIDLHEYEHELVRAALTGQTLPFERDIVERNYQKAIEMYTVYSSGARTMAKAIREFLGL
jgi:hypothetical protein